MMTFERISAIVKERYFGPITFDGVLPHSGCHFLMCKVVAETLIRNGQKLHEGDQIFLMMPQSVNVLLGIPIVVDDTLAPNEWRLVKTIEGEVVETGTVPDHSYYANRYVESLGETIPWCSGGHPYGPDCRAFIKEFGNGEKPE